MGTQFTPGPWWVAADCADFDTLAVYSNAGNKIVFWGGHYNVPVPEGEANARLIAAAPELYAALTNARDFLEYCGYGDSWERECAKETKLPQLIEAALALVEES